MKVGISIFNRVAHVDGHVTSSGMLIMPPETSHMFGSELLSVSGSVRDGLSMSSALPDDKEPGKLTRHSLSHSKRLSLRAVWIGFSVPPQQKGWAEIEIDEPKDGLLTLPAIAPHELEWTQAKGGRPRPPSPPTARKDAKAVTVLDQKRGPAIAVEPVPALIDLGDLMSAVGFVNEALRTGLVVPRIGERGEVRLSLKGSLG